MCSTLFAHCLACRGIFRGLITGRKREELVDCIGEGGSKAIEASKAPPNHLFRFLLGGAHVMIGWNSAGDLLRRAISINEGGMNHNSRPSPTPGLGKEREVRDYELRLEYARRILNTIINYSLSIAGNGPRWRTSTDQIGWGSLSQERRQAQQEGY